MKGKGRFVVLEGIDGCGKSLQIKLLKRRLKREGKRVIFTKEHTDGLVGRVIDQVVNKKANLDPISLQLLFVADRVDHLKRVVEPALRRGYLVVSDRYFWSTVAYGSLVAEKEWLLEINRVCLKPDLVILLDLPAEAALNRKAGSRRRLTVFEEKEKLKRVRKIYLWLSKRFADSCVVVNGEGDAEAIHREIYRRIKEFI